MSRLPAALETRLRELGVGAVVTASVNDVERSAVPGSHAPGWDESLSHHAWVRALMNKTSVGRYWPVGESHRAWPTTYAQRGQVVLFLVSWRGVTVATYRMDSVGPQTSFTRPDGSRSRGRELRLTVAEDTIWDALYGVPSLHPQGPLLSWRVIA